MTADCIPIRRFGSKSKVPKLSKKQLDTFKVVGHEHEADEVHTIAGKPGAAKFKWIMSEETFFTESPCTVHILGGTYHRVEWLEVNEPITVVALVPKGKYP